MVLFFYSYYLYRDSSSVSCELRPDGGAQFTVAVLPLPIWATLLGAVWVIPVFSLLPLPTIAVLLFPCWLIAPVVLLLPLTFDFGG